MLAELFRSFAYCSTFFIFYQSIHWFLERIHKDSKILPFVKIGRWVIYALTCSFTAASWAYFVFYNVFTVESTEVEKFAHYNRVWIKLLATRRIIWWLVSLEILAWLSYSGFKVYKTEFRAARVSFTLFFLFNFQSKD